MSCTSPSVIMIAPPTRSGGASASAPRSAANSLRALGVRFLARGFDDAEIDVAERLEPRLEFVARLVGLARPLADVLARRAVDDDGDDVLQRTPVLLHEIGIAEAERAAARRRARAATRRARRRQTSATEMASAAAASAISAQGGRRGEKAIDQTLNASAFR